MNARRLQPKAVLYLLPACAWILVTSACADQALPFAPASVQAVQGSGGNPLIVPVLSLADTFPLPDIDVSDASVDMCAALPGLCGSTICPAGEITGPSSERKGTGFALKGCGSLSKLVFRSIKAKMNGRFVFSVQIDPAQIGVDPGCIEKTITVPATPFVPATPAIYGLFGKVIWPGSPAIPARAASTYTVRIPLGCDPVRPPSIDHPASLASFTAFADPRIDVELEVEAAGSGEVELRIPVPGASKTVRVPVGELASNSAHMLTAAAGVYLVFRGRLTETSTTFVAKVTEDFLGDFAYDAANGFSATQTDGAFAVSGSISVQSPDTVQFRYGIQPAVSVQLQPFPPPIPGVLGERPGFQIEAGLWINRYFENILTAQPDGNLKNDSNAGLEGRIYGGFAGFEAGQEGACDRSNILDCFVGVFAAIPTDVYDHPFTCCRTDMYEQYGVGQFAFHGRTTGESIDLDPDGYHLSWTRANANAAPYVDSVMNTALGTNGTARYPDVNGYIANLPSNPFGIFTITNCTELHSDGVINVVSPGVGLVIPELRRLGVNVPNYSRTIGCASLPGDYTLTVSGLAENCALQQPNPRAIVLRPLLNLTSLGAASSPIAWSQVRDETNIDVKAHCRPLVGDLHLTSSTTGVDLDPDGYDVSLDGALKGSAPTIGASTLAAIRVGRHEVGLSGVAFNCTVAAPDPQAVDIRFETTTEASVQISCVSVYSRTCTAVQGALIKGKIIPYGTENSLCSKLTNADAARARGDLAAVKGMMDAFVSEVLAEEGKHISEETAAILLGNAAYIASNGYFMPAPSGGP